VAPNAVGKDAFWGNLVAGKSAIDKITAFHPSHFSCKIAAEVRSFDPTKFINPKRARQMWRFSHFAVASAVMAVEDARLHVNGHLAPRTGVCFGTTTTGLGTAEQIHAEILATGFSRSLTQVAVQCPPHAPTTHVATELGVTGPTLTISSNCCTGLDVIATSSSQIVAGSAKIVIAGACEAPLFPFTFSTFSALGLLSTRSNDDPIRASRPFDLLRDGLVLREGGGAVVLEDLEFARARGARIYAEVAGYASVSDAMDTRHINISGATLAGAIKLAIKAANTTSSAIDYINAHGNSLPDHDLRDTNAFKIVFGTGAYDIPITSIKSILGQAISSGSLFQVASACMTTLFTRICTRPL
jgi:3-oxoacyl-[acyl-carrier-protein] synthase II